VIAPSSFRSTGPRPNVAREKSSSIARTRERSASPMAVRTFNPAWSQTMRAEVAAPVTTKRSGFASWRVASRDVAANEGDGTAFETRADFACRGLRSLRAAMSPKFAHRSRRSTS
jgi:hypothetical protein